MTYVLSGGSTAHDPAFGAAIEELARSSRGDRSVYYIVEPDNDALRNWVVQEGETTGVRASAPRATEGATRQEGISASVIVLLGGDPGAYVGRLSDSEEWAAVSEAVGRGAALVGSSAGVECLGGVARRFPPDDKTLPHAWIAGLGVFPRCFLLTHFDNGLRSGDPSLIAWRNQFNARVTAEVDGVYQVVGIDDETRLVGDGRDWQVTGKGAVHLRTSSGWRHYASGELVHADLLSSGDG